MNKQTRKVLKFETFPFDLFPQIHRTNLQKQTQTVEKNEFNELSHLSFVGARGGAGQFLSLGRGNLLFRMPHFTGQRVKLWR
jgi:hypothetical protein